jgi:hypothetical protein
MLSPYCLDNAGVIAGILNGAVNLTGDYFSSMFLIVIFLILGTMALQLPMEVSAIFVLPFTIVCYACVPNFTAVTGVLLIYIGIVLAKNIFLK